ncbi:FAD binding domain protein [Aspergillus fumigatus Af293]|uniref:L-ornithine N(5)-monooxygenase n=1 Tax=Aspergillus fumigatus (strain ATCC MYA-4609 / CBS 101355 / FGSC A1100 / Af293) TaxID=330879 RepID=Q4WXU0_ASPFU|nr:FAD binding domain protein [Aspergillus fumigatus Af293]EAL92513.1 FAD binding domain protein [Aspergillus fumigatus Af293]
MSKTQPSSSSFPLPTLHDVIIIGAGPCGLAVAARLNEPTPSAMFTDEEHQRYHWINKHSGRMTLVQAHGKKLNAVKAEKWQSYDKRQHQRQGRGRSPSSTASDSSEGTWLSSPPSLSSSPSSVDDRQGTQMQAMGRKGGISMLVLDGTAGGWMERWHRAFRALEIAQLRSPMFFHVDPADRDGMLAYTQETGREKDLWEIPGCVGKEVSKHKKKKRLRGKPVAIGEVEIDERDRKDYFSPSTGLFADYCASIIERYGLDAPGLVLQNEVDDICYGFHEHISPAEKIFTVTANDGRQFYSRAAVLAIGPGKTKIFPFEMSAEEKMGACHSSEIQTFPSPNVKSKIQQRQETNVVVVGGGLSSAQIVDMAVRKGVTKVWFLMRSDLKERLEMIKIARNGGSITPRYQKIVKHHAARNRVSIHTRTVIRSKEFCPSSQTWRLTTDPPIPDLPPIDYIYCATGMKCDVRELPLLNQMHRDYPIETKQGLPCITDDLMWRTDVPLFVTGRLASLRIGPGAPNLEGARLGAERIAWAMEEVLGRKEAEDDEVGRSRECFCGLGNRYAELLNEGEFDWEE